MRALHTPGHRPEHTAFALIDTRRGSEPWAVLSGDSLFVGDVARPDLAIEKSRGRTRDLPLAARHAVDAARRLRAVAAHLGGSMCGGPGMDMKICSTVGFEKQHNPLLADRG